MSKKTEKIHYVELDERWMQEWVLFGIKEWESYLLKHQAFERYCERRENGEA